MLVALTAPLVVSDIDSSRLFRYTEFVGTTIEYVDENRADKAATGPIPDYDFAPVSQNGQNSTSATIGMEFFANPYGKTSLVSAELDQILIPNPVPNDFRLNDSALVSSDARMLFTVDRIIHTEIDYELQSLNDGIARLRMTEQNVSGGPILTTMDFFAKNQNEESKTRISFRPGIIYQFSAISIALSEASDSPQPISQASVEFTFTQVPEPSTTLIVGVGLLGLIRCRRR